MSPAELEAGWERCRARARRIAIRDGIAMAVGWQFNDVTGDMEPGYCPAGAVGPCFVQEVTERYQAGTGERCG